MEFVAAGLLVLSGAILIGLAYHNTLSEGWQDISAPLGTQPHASTGVITKKAQPQ